MIRAKCVPRFRDSHLYDLRVTDIQYMQTVKETLIETFTIAINSMALDEPLVSDLVTLINDSPGKTRLCFQIKDAESNNVISLRSKAKSIEIKRDLISFIERNPALSYKIN